MRGRVCLCVCDCDCFVMVQVWGNVMKWSIHEQMECKKGKYGKCRGKCGNWVSALRSLSLLFIFYAFSFCTKNGEMIRERTREPLSLYYYFLLCFSFQFIFFILFQEFHINSRNTFEIMQTKYAPNILCSFIWIP